MDVVDKLKHVLVEQCKDNHKLFDKFKTNPIISSFEEISTQCAALKKSIVNEQTLSPIGLTHMDLLCGNCMWEDSTQTMRLLDFE
mmetsp:Transcript_55318/g.120584  ORF Transcript_55318/g.120584 Transcript_55318/m.120584 type:complete len:85 (+) Transcript_55318:475-729(+)